MYFNSREGYLKKIFPIDNWVIISGKVNYYRNKYQITNPDYVTKLEYQDYVLKKIPKYNLTQGLNEKKYRFISEQVTKNLPKIEDWLSDPFIKSNKLLEWNDTIKKLHNSNDNENNKSKSYRRIVFDEICANLITLSKSRNRVKREKKRKIFNEKISTNIINNLPFKLTKGQTTALTEINFDLKSDKRMFRIVQGDVGSGKTIITLLSIANVIESGYQTAYMGPTEILAFQHFQLAKKIFEKEKIVIEFLSGKTNNNKRKLILNKLKEGKIDLIIGTHALFQKKLTLTT